MKYKRLIIENKHLSLFGPLSFSSDFILISSHSPEFDFRDHFFEFESETEAPSHIALFPPNFISKKFFSSCTALIFIFFINTFINYIIRCRSFLTILTFRRLNKFT